MAGLRRVIACSVAAVTGATVSFVIVAAVSGEPVLTIGTAVFGSASAGIAAVVESGTVSPTVAGRPEAASVPLAPLLDLAVGSTGVVLHDRRVPSQMSIRIDHLAIDRSGIWILTDAREDLSSVRFHVQAALDLERALLSDLEHALGRGLSEPVRSVVLVNDTEVADQRPSPDRVLVCTPAELTAHLHDGARHFVAPETVTYLGGIADLHLQSKPVR